MDRIEKEWIDSVDFYSMSPSYIHNFLMNGQPYQEADFIQQLMDSCRDAMNSPMFRDYILLRTRYQIFQYMQSLGVNRKEFANALETDDLDEIVKTKEGIYAYVTDLIRKAIIFRDQVVENQAKQSLKRAVDYIDSNYMTEGLSLSMVAEAVGITSTYLSALISQEMSITFVEYVTNKRITHAKKLLCETDMRTSDIAYMVGFHDAHYFSFVFKKTQGCTPRDYRNENKKI